MLVSFHATSVSFVFLNLSTGFHSGAVPCVESECTGVLVCVVLVLISAGTPQDDVKLYHGCFHGACG